MNPYIAEFLGTMLLIIMGVGVVANVSLKDTFANGGGWVVITFGWGFGVFIGVIVAGPYSGAHINPAVSIGLAIAGKFPWQEVPMYVLSQLAGAMTGAFLVWWQFSDHYNKTEDPGAILGTFCTSPAIKNPLKNLYSEILGTFVLVFVVLYIVGAEFSADSLNNTTIGLGSIGALPVAFLVVGIGMSLGGTTGYAINPARDLGPRLVHALVPIKSKGSSNFSYVWVPILGPIIGALVAAFLFLVIS
ncbi:MAG: aquaporin [Bacteroidetes bacterium]|nr:MAG: aquaporin [Bacteroidota bacterium]